MPDHRDADLSEGVSAPNVTAAEYPAHRLRGIAEDPGPCREAVWHLLTALTTRTQG